MSNENIFIKLSKKRTMGLGVNVYIKDIATVYANNPKILKDVENLKIYNKKNEENWDYIDSMDILNKIGQYNPELQINLLGADDVLLELKSREEEKPIFEFFKVALICILLLLGTALAIVNFHEDVNMAESMEKLYYTFTGEKNSNPYIMTIPYSIGLVIGMGVFFNRIISSSKRRKKEPGPMEMELYLYDADMEECLIEKIMQSKKENE